MGQSKKKTNLGKALIRSRFATNPNFKINDDGMIKNAHNTDKDLQDYINMKRCLFGVNLVSQKKMI